MTPKQLVFVSEYLTRGNATAAYKLAYGVSDDDTAAAGASRLLRNVKVSAYLNDFKNKLMQDTQITLSEVVARIDAISKSAQNDSDKLRALDMLMKHLGGYVTAKDMIDKMDAETANEIYDRLLEKIKQ